MFKLPAPSPSSQKPDQKITLFCKLDRTEVSEPTGMFFLKTTCKYFAVPEKYIKRWNTINQEENSLYLPRNFCALHIFP